MIACLSQITTFATPIEPTLLAYARSGWSAIELWLTAMEGVFESGVTVDSVAEQFRALGLTAAAAAGQGGLFGPPGAHRTAHWTQFERRLEWLQALGVPVLVLSPDFPERPTGEDLARAARSFAEAADLAGRYGVRLALEPQRGAGFCASLDTALAFVSHSEAPGAGVCLDLFHFYTGPSKSEDLALLTAENLLHVQVCDLSGVPREVATDADRIFPGEGDFAVEAILRMLHGQVGYRGPVSVETLNPHLRTMPVDRVAMFANQALLRVLGGATDEKGEAEP